MRKFTSIILTIFLLLQSGLVFAELTSYPYDNVTYYIEKAEFVGDSSMEVTITYTSNYGSVLDFHTISYLEVFNQETGVLLETSSQYVELLKPFLNTSRVSIKQNISISKASASIFKVKAAMVESLTSMRPNCPVPYLTNEIVITTANSRVPVITADIIFSEIDLDKTRLDTTINIIRITQYDEASNINWYDTGYVNVKTNGVNLKGLQGLMLSAVIDVSDDSDLKLVSVTKKEGKNIELLVDPSLFVDTNITAPGYATYYKTPNDDITSKLQIEYLTIYNNLSRSYNGNLVRSIGDTAYKFVDTDNNGKYDTVYVTNETSFVIGYVNIASKKIFRETSNSNAMTTFFGSSILLDPLADYIDWSLKDATGKDLTLADLKVGQVANVKLSDDGSNEFYEIVITDTKIEGIITEVYSETRKVGSGADIFYVIGDKAYQAVSDVNLKPADSISATLNNQGKIILYTISTGARNFGVVTGVDVINSFGNVVQVQLMKTNAEIVTLNFAKTVTVDGINMLSSNMIMNGTSLMNYGYTPILQQGSLFIYETNTLGEIKTIYTNTAGIQSIDDTMKFVNIMDAYRATSERLGSNYIIHSSAIFAVKTATLTDKNDVSIASKSLFVDEDIYAGTAIVKDGNIQAVVVFSVGNTVRADSFPMAVTAISTVFVDGSARTKLKGLVNGIEVEYVGEEDLVTIYSVNVNDVIQFALNTKGEISILSMLVDYTNSAFIVTDNGNLGGMAKDDTNVFNYGKTVNLNLATGDIPPSAVYTIGSATSGVKGFAAAGRAYEVQGNTLRLINKTYDNVCAVDGIKDYNTGAIVDGDISDFAINSSTIAYMYNGITNKMQATTIADLETEKGTNDYATTGRDNDDLVYVYNYNGETYMILIVDTEGDNSGVIGGEIIDSTENELTIDPTLFIDTNIYSQGYVTYYKTTTDDKVHKAPIENLSIYNNSVKIYNTELKYALGDVAYKFVDTDKNGKYDTVFVTNEKSFVIGPVDTTYNTIFREINNSNAMSTFSNVSITLDPLNTNLDWSLKDATGKDLTLADLKAGQIANVRVSNQGSYYFYDILITEEKIEGTITEVHSETRKVGGVTDTFYVIGDKAYKTVSPIALSPGDTISATLNNQGEIIIYSTGVRNYGVVTGVDVISSFGNIAQIQLMTVKGEIFTLNLAKTVTVNGVSKISSIDFDTIAKVRAVVDQGSLFIYELNSANEIKTIYTTTSGIASKDSAMKFVTVADAYRASAEKLGSNYLIENSAIFAVKTAMLTDKNDLIVSSKTLFVDDDIYTGTAIVKDGDIQAIVLFNAGNTVRSDSFPMVVTSESIVSVDGNSRTKLKGLVNGVEVEYISEEDFMDIDGIETNDIIQFALNSNNEISNINKLVDYTATAFIVSDNGNLGGKQSDEEKAELSGKAITLNLTKNEPFTSNVYTIGATTASFKGFAAAGRAYEVKGKTLRLISDTYDKVCSGAGVKNYNNGAIVDGYISDYTINPNTVAYIYNGITKKIKATTITDLETDKATNDYATTSRDNDDLVYVYNYNGETYMILIIDTEGDIDQSVLENGSFLFSVGSVNAKSNKIYASNKNSFSTLFRNNIHLDQNTENLKYTIKDTSGQTMSLADIMPNDIINLSVTKQLNVPTKYGITVSRKTISGLVTERTLNYCTMNGQIYPVNQSLDFTNNDVIKAYLDKNNYIVSFEMIRNYSYAVVTGINNVAQVQLMNSKGEISALSLAENVIVNGITKTSSKDFDTIWKLKAILDQGSLFLYEVNSANEIKALYTNTASIQAKDYEMKFVDISDYYRAISGKIGSNYVLSSSLIYAVKTPVLDDNKNLSLSSKALFVDKEMYSGKAIVKDGELQAVVLFNTSSNATNY